jgi:ubiquinone/menaquinone biosynthesis C-methylase UbiE
MGDGRMSDAGDTAKVDWNERARYWSQAAPAGRSTNDAPNQLLIAKARIGVGDRVLDLASGAGEPAISIALTVGETGQVVALDSSERMLQGLAERAVAMGLGNIETRLGDLDELDLEAGAYDAATCRFGLMFAADPVATLNAVRRALKPGARAAFMVHGPPDQNHMYTTVRAAVLAHFGEEDDGRAMRRFRFSGEGELKALFEASGFSDVEEEFISKSDVRPAGEPFWDALLMRAFGARVSSLPDDERAALDARIAEAFAPFRADEGIVLTSTERVGSGAA